MFQSNKLRFSLSFYLLSFIACRAHIIYFFRQVLWLIRPISINVLFSFFDAKCSSFEKNIPYVDTLPLLSVPIKIFSYVVPYMHGTPLLFTFLLKVKVKVSYPTLRQNTFQMNVEYNSGIKSSSCLKYILVQHLSYERERCPY